MKAYPVRRAMRPDGGASPLGGNTHLLPNGNLWTSWACDGYASEHDQYGNLTMEVIFRSDRFLTYRAYKSDFRARPLEPPALKCVAYGTSATKAITVCYVSWNGATEVRQWRFYNVPSQGEPQVKGTIGRKGFETMIQLQGYMPAMLVQGLGAIGETLGTSAEVKVLKVKDWLLDDGNDDDIRDDSQDGMIAHDEL